MRQRRTGYPGVGDESDLGKMGDKKRQATAPWDWETSRHGVVNHGPTVRILTTDSQPCEQM